LDNRLIGSGIDGGPSRRGSSSAEGRLTSVLGESKKLKRGENTPNELEQTFYMPWLTLKNDLERGNHLFVRAGQQRKEGLRTDQERSWYRSILVTAARRAGRKKRPQLSSQMGEADHDEEIVGRRAGPGRRGRDQKFEKRGSR